MSGKRAKAKRSAARDAVDAALLERPEVKKELQRRVADLYHQKHEWFIENEVYCMLFTLRTTYGFGAKRLRKFADCYTENWRALADYYSEGRLDAPYLAREAMLRDGIDVSEWI